MAAKPTINIEEYLVKESSKINRIIEELIPHQIDKKWLEQMFGTPSYGYDVESLQKGMIDPFWDLLDRGGKRWRPALFLLSLEAVGGNVKKYYHYTALPEVVHNGCLSGDTLIWTQEGVPKPISEVETGEMVLSLDADFALTPRKVVKKLNNGSKPVLEITTRNRRIEATENHPFLVARKKQPGRMLITQRGRIQLESRMERLGFTISSFCEKTYASLGTTEFSLKHMKNALYGMPHCALPSSVVQRIANTINLPLEDNWITREMTFEKADILFEWKEAKELKKGDLVVITKNIASDTGELPVLRHPKPHYRDRNHIPTIFTPELSQLAGFLLGDGSIDSNGRTTLCLPRDGIGRAEYERLVNDIFGAQASLSEETITICSRAVAEMFTHLGLAKYALQKEIPTWVFRLPRVHRLSFIKGYIDSDGTVTKKGITTFECASRPLIIQMKALLDSMGFITGNVRHRMVDNTHFERYVNKPETELFCVSLSSPNKVLKEIGTEIQLYQDRLGQTRTKAIYFRQEEEIPSLPPGFDGNKLGFNRIERITPLGEKKTFDVEIEGTHNYFSNGIVTHNTLVADDVEDNSELRRGKPCIHKTYGVDVAVNLSSAMYFFPFAMVWRDKSLTPIEKNKVSELITFELLRCHAGQGLDIWWHKGKKFAITEQEYLQMCAYKTGTLARLSAKLGATLGKGTEEQTEALGRFAETIGTAFQIQDDILNLVGEEFSKGKGVGEDIHEGKRTIMVLRTIEKATEKEKKRLTEILNAHPADEKTIREAISIIQRYDGIEYGRKKAKELVEASWKKVDKVLPPSHAKEVLEAFAHYLINRKI